jgi:hypothetical protein
MNEILKKMLDASEDQRIEMARKRTQEMIKLPIDKLAKEIEATMRAFNSLNDDDMKVLIRASVIAVDELPPETKSIVYLARAKASLSVPKEINYRVLAAGANATRDISEESYQFFKKEYNKACNKYKIPFPDFLK